MRCYWIRCQCREAPGRRPEDSALLWMSCRWRISYEGDVPGGESNIQSSSRSLGGQDKSSSLDFARIRGALGAQVQALNRLQAETAAELDAFLPSILDKAFKGEL